MVKMNTFEPLDIKNYGVLLWHLPEDVTEDNEEKVSTWVIF